MKPSPQEEALLDLMRCCSVASAEFDQCARRAQSPQLADALRQRSAQCRTACSALPVAGPPATTGPQPKAVDASPRTLTDDAAVFLDYELIEGRVLSTFRDALDQTPQGEIAATVVLHFEIALNQYMHLAALRPSGTPSDKARRGTVDSPAPLPA